MMTIDDLFAWGAAYGYPRMVLTTRPLVMLGAGWESWYTFLRTAPVQQVAALEARVLYWQQSYRIFCAITD